MVLFLMIDSLQTLKERNHMNTITDLLNLEDADIIVSDILTDANVKTIILETRPSVNFCPLCGFRMHSRGIKVRTINHPVLQDSFRLILRLRQRRWRCTNPQCCYEVNESFNFVNKGRRNTNASDMLIVNAFRDLSLSSSAIAERFHVSDSHVLDIFDRYVKLDRLPLTDIISVDEVHLDLDPDCRYALVIQDFHTGDPIDLLRSRRTGATEPYFASIPLTERLEVKYLISDMYNPYIRFVEKYFPNAVSVVDSFHVIQWITHSIDNYIRQLIRKLKQRDKERHEAAYGMEVASSEVPLSREVYLLQKYRWLILMNQSSITYHNDLRMDHHLHCMMNTYDYEDALFRIDPRLQTLRELKEMYVSFNARNAGQPMDARIDLDGLIDHYLHCGDPMFADFAGLLIRHHDYIINSFVMAERHGNGRLYDSRLSNGPIESLNRKAKDLRRLGRGYRNFDHFRNRFLYAARNNPTLSSEAAYSSNIYYQNDD